MSALATDPSVAIVLNRGLGVKKAVPDRAQRLQRLKAFGLFIRGEHTLYKIAETLGIAEINPSTAAGRARTRVEQGWRIICERRVARWDAYWSREFPAGEWQTLYGARLGTHPRKPLAPPAPPPTPFERLLGRLEEVEQEARHGGFAVAAEGLRNLRAALCYNQRTAAAEKREAGSCG